MAQALCEWGPRGIETLAPRARVFVIVDVLSFCTAVDIAVSRGGFVIPFAADDHKAAAKAANAAGAVLASRRRDEPGNFSLSPASLKNMAPGTRLVLPSPNGSRLSLMGGRATVFSGCLRNAGAVARAALSAADGGDVAVVPAGERWRSDRSLRPAIEDIIGAGAILDALGLPQTPEAQVACAAFGSARSALDRTIRGSLSGRELMDRGFPEDIDLAIELNASSVAPVLRDGMYTNY